MTTIRIDSLFCRGADAVAMALAQSHIALELHETMPGDYRKAAPANAAHGSVSPGLAGSPCQALRASAP
jgi:hypothetical protein